MRAESYTPRNEQDEKNKERMTGVTCVSKIVLEWYLKRRIRGKRGGCDVGQWGGCIHEDRSGTRVVRMNIVVCG